PDHARCAVDAGHSERRNRHRHRPRFRWLRRFERGLGAHLAAGWVYESRRRNRQLDKSGALDGDPGTSASLFPDRGSSRRGGRKRSDGNRRPGGRGAGRRGNSRARQRQCGGDGPRQRDGGRGRHDGDVPDLDQSGGRFELGHHLCCVQRRRPACAAGGDAGAARSFPGLAGEHRRRMDSERHGLPERSTAAGLCRRAVQQRPDAGDRSGQRDGRGHDGSFEVLTSPVAVPTPVTITATFAGSTLSSTLILNPARALASLTVSPASVPGGTAATGTVTLDEVALAPVGISLFSRNEGVVTVPAGVTVPVGARSASFPISTTWTPYSIDVELDAYLYDPNGSKMRTATINVTHPVTLVAIGLNPDTVRGGTSSTGWVTLDGAAPPGGVAVALASSNTAIATVPVSVIVPAGVAVIDFNVSTAAGASGSVTISGSYAGTTR